MIYKHTQPTDEQIYFAHEVEIKILMIQNTLSEIMKAVDAYTTHHKIDSDILASLGIVHDGVTYATECLNDTLHDSSLSSYKTSDELFFESEEAKEEATTHRDYRDNVTYLYNYNKM